MQAMYPGIPFSPPAALTQTISETDTVIHVDNVDAFPDAPNYATIGTDEQAETIRYSAKGEGILSGCTRAVEGTAKIWQAGEVIARNFTAQDLQIIQDNLSSLDSSKADKVNGATSGHLAGLDSSGNLTDSGKTISDFVQTINGIEPDPSGNVDLGDMGAEPAAESAAASGYTGLLPASWVGVTTGSTKFAVAAEAVDEKYTSLHTALAKGTFSGGSYQWEYVELDSSIPLTFKAIRSGKLNTSTSGPVSIVILGGNFVLISGDNGGSWIRHNLTKNYNVLVMADDFDGKSYGFQGYIPYNILLAGDDGYATSVDGSEWTETAWPFTLPDDFSPCDGVFGRWGSIDASIYIVGNAQSPGSKCIRFYSRVEPVLLDIGMKGYWNSAAIGSSYSRVVICNNNDDMPAEDGLTEFGAAWAMPAYSSSTEVWNGITIASGCHWEKICSGYIFSEGEERYLLMGNGFPRFTTLTVQDTPAETSVDTLNFLDIDSHVKLVDVKFASDFYKDGVNSILLCAEGESTPGKCMAYWNGASGPDKWEEARYTYQVNITCQEPVPARFHFTAPEDYVKNAFYRVNNNPVILEDVNGSPVGDYGFGKGMSISVIYTSGKLQFIYPGGQRWEEHLARHNPHCISCDMIGAIPLSQKGASNGVASLSGTKVKAEQRSAPLSSNYQTARQLSLNDAGQFIYCTNTNATTITIPNNTSVAFPADTEIEIMRYSTGSVTIAAASGVTILCTTSSRTLRAQYSTVRLKRISTNRWLLAGDLT